MGYMLKKLNAPIVGRNRIYFILRVLGVEDSFLNAKIRHADKNLK